MAKRTLTVIEAEARAAIVAFNEAVSADNMNAMNKASNELAELEKEYTSLAEKVCYAHLKETDKPMLNAIKAYGFDVISHKDVTVKETIISADEEEEEISYIRRELTIKEKQIDLIKFDAYGKNTVSVDASWKYKLQSVNQMFCLRTAQDLNVPFSCDSYFMDKLAERIKNGETPVSNTQLLNALQGLIDMIIFEPQETDKDKNVYRANSRDVTALRMQYTKSGKGRTGIACAKHNYFARLIGKVLYRIVTGEDYSLEYKTSKDK